MPELRDVLTGEGFEHVRTYVQSGNVVLTSDTAPDELARVCEQLIHDRFDLQIPVVVRTHADLAAVVQRNPLKDVATNPKRYQVTFLADDLDPAIRAKLDDVAAEEERFVVLDREIYTWHPDTIARSRLWTLLAGPRLGVTATARNWTTVTTLLQMADDTPSG